MDQDCFWLSDEQFSRLEPHLPQDTRGKLRVDDRRVISGCRWKSCFSPYLYRSRNVIEHMFNRLNDFGVSPPATIASPSPSSPPST